MTYNTDVTFLVLPQFSLLLFLYFTLQKHITPLLRVFSMLHCLTLVVLCFQHLQSLLVPIIYLEGTTLSIFSAGFYLILLRVLTTSHSFLTHSKLSHFVELLLLFVTSNLWLPHSFPHACASVLSDWYGLMKGSVERSDFKVFCLLCWA